MKTFKAWWNSPHTGDDPSLLSHRECAEAAWNFAYEMQDHRLNEVAKQNIEFRERINYLEKVINANQMRMDYSDYEEPVEVDHIVYVATHNTEQDTFYVGTLTEIMEWCEDWNHGISSLNFFRLGDEVRVGFVDMGKETRFNRTLSPDDIV